MRRKPSSKRIWAGSSAEEGRLHRQGRPYEPKLTGAARNSSIRDDSSRHRAYLVTRRMSDRREGLVTSGTRHHCSEGDRLRYLPMVRYVSWHGFEVDIRGRRVPARSSRGNFTSVPELTYVSSDRRYTKDHEWIIVTGNLGRVGITDFAPKPLCECGVRGAPRRRRAVTQGQTAYDRVRQGVSELQPCIPARVRRQHGPREQAGTGHKDAHGAWLYDIELGNLAEVENLLNNDQYAELVK